MKYAIVEKNNPLAVHAICSTKESAELHLRENVPRYVKRGYYMDKTLKPEDFIVVPWNR
jgi:hypothetical protein